MEFRINLPEFSHIKIQNSGEAVQQFMKMTDLPAQNQRVRFSLIYLPQTQPKVQRECTLVVFLAGVNQIWCTSFLYDILILIDRVVTEVCCYSIRYLVILTGNKTRHLDQVGGVWQVHYD